MIVPELKNRLKNNMPVFNIEVAYIYDRYLTSITP